MQSCTLGLKKYVLQLESSTVGSDIEREDLDALVAHGKECKKDVARCLSEEQENMQDTSKVSAGTMLQFQVTGFKKGCVTLE